MVDNRIVKFVSVLIDQQLGNLACEQYVLIDGTNIILCHQDDFGSGL
jgi:hypothetical protein